MIQSPCGAQDNQSRTSHFRGLRGLVMAGDWIPIRCDLHEDPDVISVALSLGITEDEVVGKLVRLWSWANRMSANGLAPSVTFVWLNSYLRLQGFCEALEAVGWLAQTNNGIEIPKFDRYNSHSAKRRLQDSKRKRLKRTELTERTERPQNVTEPSGQTKDVSRTKSGTREEKRRDKYFFTPFRSLSGDASRVLRTAFRQSRCK